MKYTAWGSVRGCCGHLHETIDAARGCIRRDRRNVREGNGTRSYSDRSVRVVEGRDDLERYDVTQGPGRPLTDEEVGR